MSALQRRLQALEARHIGSPAVLVVLLHQHKPTVNALSPDLVGIVQQGWEYVYPPGA